MKVKCPKCKKTYEAKPYEIRNDELCPSCARVPSTKTQSSSLKESHHNIETNQDDEKQIILEDSELQKRWNKRLVKYIVTSAIFLTFGILMIFLGSDVFSGFTETHESMGESIIKAPETSLNFWYLGTCILAVGMGGGGLIYYSSKYLYGFQRAPYQPELTVKRFFLKGFGNFDDDEVSYLESYPCLSGRARTLVKGYEGYVAKVQEIVSQIKNTIKIPDALTRPSGIYIEKLETLEEKDGYVLYDVLLRMLRETKKPGEPDSEYSQAKPIYFIARVEVKKQSGRWYIMNPEWTGKPLSGFNKDQAKKIFTQDLQDEQAIGEVHVCEYCNEAFPLDDNQKGALVECPHCNEMCDVP